MGRYISTRRISSGSGLPNGAFNNLIVSGYATIAGVLSANNNFVAAGSSNLAGNVVIGTTAVNTFTINSTTTFKAPIDFQADSAFTTSGGVKMPSGSTAQRPAAPSPGVMRFNSTLTNLEFFNGASWELVGTGSGTGGATGGGTDKIFYENEQIVNTDYTLSPGKNAVTAGPVVIGIGATVTIPSGAGWAVV